jgi:AAA domain, putative AbiEii toxin, Type IV TA system
MRKFTIELMNYRCFSGAPVRWTFAGEGLTSFIGPNNAGKSTFIRLAYELRSVFQSLAQHLSVFATTQRALNFDGTEDVAEVPSFGTQGPVVIDLAIEASDPAQLTRVRMSMDRRSGAWTPLLFTRTAGGEVIEAPLVGRFPPIVTANGQQTQMLLTEFTQWAASLSQRLMYIPAYRNLINQGGGTYYDIQVGTDFIKTWDVWKSGGNVGNRRLILEVISDIKSIFGFSELPVDANPEKTTFQIVVDGRSERIRELGAGLSQFIIVLGNVAIKRPEMLFIDEPELNLHPALQLKFLNALAKYSKHVIYASHSIGLARAAERAYSVTREASGSVIKPLPAVNSYAELLGELSFSAYRELGFERVLCVEGLHDVRPMQTFLRLFELDQKTVVIPLGGGQFIAANRGPELAELLRITDKLAILIDSEKAGAEQPLSPERQAFVDACRELGINVHVTERRAFEHYLSDAAVKAAKGDASRALTPYEDFTTFAQAWPKRDNWRIAERMTAEELADTDVGCWILEMRGTPA